MIRLIAFDLDGTLMGSNQIISPRVKQTIAQAQTQGVIITLATGRMFSATRPFAQQLNITAPLICYQGGWIQAREGEVLQRISLPVAQAAAAIRLGQTQGWHTVLYADGRLFIHAMPHPESLYHSLLGADLTVGRPWPEILAEHTVDKVLYVAAPPQIAQMVPILNAHFGRDAEVVQSHKLFIEVVPRGVEKGRALAWLAQHLSIPQPEVLAAGDQGNDVSLVRWAGVGVAMGNAVAEVQQVADWVAPPVTEDGVAAILERFVLHGAER